MGYTGVQTPTGVSSKVFLDSELSRSGTVHRSSIVGGVYYAAFSLSQSPEKITGYVGLFSRGKHEFTFKFMCEYVGPVQAKCPTSILTLLSPIKDDEDQYDWAKRWRQKSELHNFYNKRFMRNWRKFLKCEVSIVAFDPIEYTNTKFKFFRYSPMKYRRSCGYARETFKGSESFVRLPSKNYFFTLFCNDGIDFREL